MRTPTHARATVALLSVLAAGCGGSATTDLGLELPAIVGSAAIVVAPDIALVIGSKNPDARREPLSTTKMMTALLTAEALDAQTTSLDALVTISSEALEGTMFSFTMGLAEGDVISLEDLLYGMLLPSTNDAARAVAEHVGGTIENFVVMMNEKAAALDLQNTHFNEPGGLVAVECPGGDFELPQCANYSTARDLAKLADHMMAVPLLASIAGTTEHTTTTWRNAAQEPQDGTLCTTNQLLPSGTVCSTSLVYEGADGVKTGTSRQLRGVAIARATNATGETILVVVLDSSLDQPGVPGRFADATALLDFGFANLP